MVRLRSVILATLFAGTLSFNAKAIEVTLERLDGRNKGDQFALRWETEPKSCEARKSPLGASTAWVSIPTTDCQSVLEFNFKHETELASSIIGGAQAFHGKKNRGLLQLGNQKWYVDLMTAPKCDVTLTRCEDPKLSAPSLLALKVEEIVTKNLGRIH